jgi:hypothetical protein
MIIAYLDTNVFNDLIGRRCGVTDADILALRHAISRGRVTIPLSAEVLTEKLFTMEACPDLFYRDLEFIYGLVDQQKLCKDPAQLIREHIHCYAQGLPLTGCYVTDGGKAAQWFLYTAANDRRRLLELAEEVNTQKTRSLEWMTETTTDRRKGLQALKESDRTLKKQLAAASFADMWRENAERLVRGWAEREGVLEACEERGIDGLLKVRIVRITAVTYLSLFLSHDFKGRHPRKGDYGDLLHARFGTGADVFVTGDSRLREALSGVPIDGLAVMDLPTFIQEIE